MLDFDAKMKTVNSRSLTTVQNDVGIPLDEEGVINTDPNLAAAPTLDIVWTSTNTMGGSAAATNTVVSTVSTATNDTVNYDAFIEEEDVLDPAQIEDDNDNAPDPED